MRPPRQYSVKLCPHGWWAVYRDGAMRPTREYFAASPAVRTAAVMWIRQFLTGPDDVCSIYDTNGRLQVRICDHLITPTSLTEEDLRAAQDCALSRNGTHTVTLSPSQRVDNATP